MSGTVSGAQSTRVKNIKTPAFLHLQPTRRMKETNSIYNASDRDRIRRQIRQDKEIARVPWWCSG